MLKRLAVLFALLAACSPANALLHGGYTTGLVLPFQADTTKSISSITPSITCLQSGTLQTPAFIQCSASGTTASGSSNPYLDLEYVWTDNNSSPDSFTLPSPIGTRSSSKQYGPEYVTVVRSAQSFTITLTVRGCTNGHPTTRYTGGGGSCNGGAFTIATATQTFAVNAFTATNDYFFDTGGSDSNLCTSGSPCQHPSKCASLLEGGSNNRCNFTCGQTFDGTVGGGLSLTAGASYAHGRVQPVGGLSSCPGGFSVSVSSGTNSCINFDSNNSSVTKSDVVIAGLNCTFSGTASAPQMAGITCAKSTGGSVDLNGLAFDNVNLTSNLDISGLEGINIEKTIQGSTPTAYTCKGIVMWNVSTTMPTSALTTATGILGGAQLWYAVVGGTQQGSGANDVVRDHDIYIHCGGHCVARWMNTGPTCTPYPGCTPTRDNCVKTSYDPTADGDGVGTVASYWLVTENFCESVADLGGPGNNNNTPTESTIDQYIQQQNVLFEIAGGVAPASGVNIALRDNWACLTGPLNASVGAFTGNFFNAAGGSSGEDSILLSNVYRNFVYNNAAKGNGNAQEYDFNPDTWTTAQRNFDNILQTNNATGNLNNIPSSSFTSSGSFVDYNTYYAPNATNFLSNASTSVSFASWQGLGWDAHGANSNPGFPSPSTCGFGTWAY